MHFSKRSARMRTSHIREILKVAADPAIISFAGGLPAPELFPQSELAAASERVFAQPEATGALQYGRSEGLPELREWISARYQKQHGLQISPEDILITSGSQQGLDLPGKVLIDPGDPVLIEEPSYLGALQAFQIYGAEFRGVPLQSDGVDTDTLRAELRSLRKNGELRDVPVLRARSKSPAPLLYTTPDFQNPSGVLCSTAKRERIAELAERGEAIVIEDSPYSELNFAETNAKVSPDAQDPVSRPPLIRSLSERVILLGSFSKIIAPGLRLGWICAPAQQSRELYDRLLRARQAADLHTSSLTQALLLEYLRNNDLDAQITALCRDSNRATRRRARNCSGSRPRSSAAEFSNATPEEIREGMRRLARAMRSAAPPGGRQSDAINRKQLTRTTTH